tara:strand:- start:1180 stop:2094 length:915 start_codon:yes stop_codon:yes gene_type:complete
MVPGVTIVIPTYNRAAMLPRAIEAALDQSHLDTTVMVVDDGSTDDTGAVLARYADHPRFTGVQLAANVGTAQAKNVGIALSSSDAITFHDSDDLPHRHKVMRQARVMGNEAIGAHPCLNWRLSGRDPGTAIQVGGVLTHHDLILPDGERVEITRALSLVDDFFPNLQMSAGVPGDWTHVNSGLYHRSVFERLGGFADCIEEDREFRNRLIMAGEVLWVIPEILLTKIETADSLTQQDATDYDSARRRVDRARVWQTVERWFETRTVDPVPIDLSGIRRLSCTNPKLCSAEGLQRLAPVVEDRVA